MVGTDSLGLAGNQTCVAAYTTTGSICGGALGYYGGRALGGSVGASAGGLVCSETGPGALLCAAAAGASGAELGGRVGSTGGSLAGGVVGHALGQEMCADSGDECSRLNTEVQNAKEAVSKLGSCRIGMAKYQLMLRHGAWLRLAAARAKRDVKCWNNGDAGHQQAQADAWFNVGKCSVLISASGLLGG